MRGWVRPSAAAVAFTLVAGCAPIQESPGSAAVESDDGVLLISHPRLANPAYRQSVIVAVPLANDQHVGVIINRPSTRTLASAFPNHEPSRRVQAPIYFGGPTAVRALSAVVRTNIDPGEGSLKIVHGLYLVPRASAVDRIIETTPDEARYYLGHVRWRAGELRQELSRRIWYVGNPESQMLFRSDPAELWAELIQRVRAMRAAIR